MDAPAWALQPPYTPPATPLWSPESVHKLWTQQQCGWLHPHTCPNRGDGNHREIFGDLGALIPTTRGWICCFCDYTQQTAMAFPSTQPTLAPSSLGEPQVDILVQPGSIPGAPTSSGLADD